MTSRLLVASFLIAATAAAAGDHDILLNAAGATFPYPMYSQWFRDFRRESPNVHINYQPIGSGSGIQQIIDGTVDFGASDGPMNDAQMREFQDKRSAPILHFPTLLGAVVPTYNIPGVAASLNFTGDVLSSIFLGQIKRWDDPRLTRINPGIKLPGAEIVVVHRSDSSGTTYVWADYLSMVSPAWGQRVGRGTVLKWPVGLGGKGNEGVSECVRLAPNSIGYVELTFALQKQMTYGRVKNSAGYFVQASLTSVTEAAGGTSMPDDFRVSITNAPGKGAYPISSFTWLLVPAKIADPSRRGAIKDFLMWMLGEGQKSTKALAYVPLPQPVVAKEIKAIARIR